MSRLLNDTPLVICGATFAALLAAAGLLWLTRRPRDEGLPEDGEPLEDREWADVRELEAFYAETAVDPFARKSTARRRP